MVDNYFSSGFGDLLKTARTRKHLTQKRLAQLLGVHYNTISSWEQGSYLPETRGLTMELARLLDMDQQETRQLLEASLMTLSPYWNVPYRRNPFFTGRDKVLQQLHEALHSEDNTVLGQSCTLSGLGGIGKTQTAAEYVYRYADNYVAIFWIGSQTSESIRSSFFSIASVLKQPERREQEQKHVVATVLGWLNSHDHWLLVFDDVEDTALVKRFLPAERRGFILFASRWQTLSISARTLELEPMTLEEGICFLLRRAGFLDMTPSLGQLAARDEAAVQEIVSLIDGWPLALDQAGSYIEATHCSLSNYLQLYQSSQLYLLNERSSSDHPQSVMKAVTLAFEQLEQQNTQAAALLTACSFLSFEPIPDVFFREGAAYLGPAFEALAADPSMFQAAIKALLMYSFIQHNADTQMVSIHRLVQTILKGRLSLADQHQWVTRTIQAMSYLFPSEEMAQAHYWQNCEQMLPHALVCIASGKQGNYDEIAYITLMCHVAIYLTERARYAEAQQLLLQAANSEQMPAPDHPLTAKVFYHLGILYLKQGEYVEARSFLQRALSIRESALGVDHPLVAASLNGLSMLYLRQGEYAQAESLLERALNIREQTLGIDHPLVATSLNVMAALYQEQGKYEQAEAFYTRALIIREQSLGTDLPQTAALLNNLADLHQEQGKYDLAEPLFLRALQIWEQDLGMNHPRVAYPLNQLASIYREQGKYDLAEPLFLRALQVWEQRLGPDHVLVADALEGLALLYQEQDTYNLAEPLFLRALQIKQQALGPQHTAIAVSFQHLAYFHQLRHQTAKAISLYEQALEMYKLTLGPYHPKTKDVRKTYAQLLRGRRPA